MFPFLTFLFTFLNARKAYDERPPKNIFFESENIIIKMKNIEMFLHQPVNIYTYIINV